MSFKIGYLFKPTHNEIHFVKKGASLDLRLKYERNFCSDIEKAAVFEDEEKAMKVITCLVAKFKPSRDYDQTPVVVHTKTNTYKMLTCGHWSEPVFNVHCRDYR